MHDAKQIQPYPIYWVWLGQTNNKTGGKMKIFNCFESDNDKSMNFFGISWLHFKYALIKLIILKNGNAYKYEHFCYS